MPWGAVAAAVVGGVMSNQAAKKGSKSQEKASQAAIAEQQRQFNLTRQDQMPWMQAGQGALGQMQALNSGDFSQFYSSPDYTYAREQGLGAIDSRAAARGGLFGGGNTRDAMKFASGLASQNYGNFYSRLQSMSGQGQTTASGLGTLGAEMASNIGAQYNNIGQARASSYQQQGDNWGQMAGVAGNAFGNWYQNNRTQNPGGTGWYMGNNPGRG